MPSVGIISPTGGARQRLAGPALQAEFRLWRVLVLALRTLHGLAPYWITSVT
jgi:hypothetical protein